MKNQDIAIFIAAHKDYDKFPNCPIYTIVHSGELKNQYPIRVVNEYDHLVNLRQWRNSYAELTRLYHVWRCEKLPKYVGFCQYKRYFNFYDEGVDPEELFKDADVILPSKISLGGNLKSNFKSCHGKKDMDLIMEVIKESYPSYVNDAEAVYRQRNIYAHNMFIMKKDDFMRYCLFMFGVFSKFNEKRNANNDKESYEYNKAHKDDYRNEETCRRLHAFLAERVSNIFYKHNFKKIKELNLYKI